jgi:hypothetical protein
VWVQAVQQFALAENKLDASHAGSGKRLWPDAFLCVFYGNRTK